MLRVGQWPLPLGEDDCRQPGEPIPEAEEWPNLRAYIDTGRVLREGSTLRVGHSALLIAEGDLRQPGSLIPEANDWPNLRAYIDVGRIVASDEPSPEHTPGGAEQRASARPATSSHQSIEKSRARR